MKQLWVYGGMLAVLMSACTACKKSSDCEKVERCYQNRCIPYSIRTEINMSEDENGSGTEMEYPPVWDFATETDDRLEQDSQDFDSVDTDPFADTEPENNVSASELTESDWIAIQGHGFRMGDYDVENAFPVHFVRVRDFMMMRAEVTAGQYRRCVLSGVCTSPGYPDSELDSETDGERTFGVFAYRFKPVNYVSWFQAETFCEWVGGYLPTEAQWEYAASNLGWNVNYPWGDSPAPDCEHGQYAECAGMEGDLFADACALSSGSTRQGLCDMSGNVWEWTYDKWVDNYNEARDVETGEPQGEFSFEEATVRGGSILTEITSQVLDVCGRLGRTAKSHYVDVGFRCARSVR